MLCLDIWFSTKHPNRHTLHLRIQSFAMAFHTALYSREAPCSYDVNSHIDIKLVPTNIFSLTDTQFVFDYPFYWNPRTTHHIMTLCYYKRTIALTVLHQFQSLFRFFRLHDVLETVFLDIADNPFFTRTITWRHISPRVDKEEIGKGTAWWTISWLIPTKTTVDTSIEICASIVFQPVLQATTFGREHRFDKLLMCGKSIRALQLVVVLMEIPRVMHHRIT